MNYKSICFHTLRRLDDVAIRGSKNDLKTFAAALATELRSFLQPPDPKAPPYRHLHHAAPAVVFELQERGGETRTLATYDDVAAALGVRRSTVQLYLARGHGRHELTREVDGREVQVTILRYVNGHVL